MLTSSQHGLPPINSADKIHKSDKWIYTAIVLFLFTFSVLLISKTRQAKKDQAIKTEIAKNRTQNVESISMQLDSVLFQASALANANPKVQELLEKETSVFNIHRNRIEYIIEKSSTTQTEIEEATILMEKLKDRLEDWEKWVSNEQSVLGTDTIKNEDKDKFQEHLTEHQEQAPDFVIRNIRMVPINLVKRSPSELPSRHYQKVDVIRIFYDISENRNTEKYPQTFYFRIINPEGKVLSNMGLGSGKFQMRDVKEAQNYTISTNEIIPVGSLVSEMTVDWEESGNYVKGTYRIEVYHKGFRVGMTRLVFR